MPRSGLSRKTASDAPSASRRSNLPLAPSESVANSSDEEDDMTDDLDSTSITPARPTKRVLKEVAISPMAPSFKRPLPKNSTSSISSCGSTARDSSSEYDTPGTSAVVTPATSVKGKDAVHRGGEVARTMKRKRSRFVVDEDEGLMDTSGDAQLAQALQEEEYGEEDVVTKRAKTTTSSHQRRSFMDLTDEDDDLSSAESISTVASSIFEDAELRHDIQLAKARAGKKALGVGGNAANPPVRKASSNARKVIADKLNSSVQDSDLSELSVLDSEDEFLSDPSLDEESESSSDDDMPPIDLAAATNVSTADPATTTVTATGRLRRRGRRVRGERQATDRKTRERKKLEKAHPVIKTMWEALEKIPIIKAEQAKQPESINRKLKSFQLEGLNWMIKQEQTQYKGGLLGDEMGMGKTIQAVSLIMSDYPAKDPTLVVVPPVALMQWSNEISEYTDGKLKVLVYHGQNSKVKNISVKELRKYDVIMVSYNGLESLHRKETKGWSRGDVIIKEDSPLHAIHFHRLILDEAHSIKSRTTGVAKACFALQGTYKWCLSGTPVQNRIGEFFSLLRFLEVRPFADYFCKKCSCSQLHWSVDKQHRCTHCHHNGLEHVSVFNQELLNPITQSEDPRVREGAMDKLHLITARIMLRRVKRDHTASMELPPKEVIVHNEFFGEIERDFSSSIMSNTTRQFDTYVSRGVMLNNYANIFGLIMQMRQVANHPDLLLKKHSEGGQNILVCNICDEVAEEAIRSKCKHEFCRSCVKNFVKTCEASGGTPDCPRCHIALSIDWDQPDIEQDEEVVKKNSIINRIKMENWTSSTKIEMLVYDLYKLRNKKQTLKSIVFSQFTSMLQLIEWRLRRAGFNTVMLDGSMTPIQRQRSIEYFMNNTDVEVFLVSLKAGGVALNLTEASRVFIVDPWWNPAAEWQSADRCHRIGQKRPCVITRLCIEDSVESRMVMLQEKKANMINGTINNDKVAMDKLTPEDMQFLFRGT
ncbi:SNF2 family N-terminal domain-containing protein [Cryomyces antarcticus]